MNIGALLLGALIMSLVIWGVEYGKKWWQQTKRDIAKSILADAFEALGVRPVDLAWSGDAVSGVIQYAGTTRSFGVYFKGGEMCSDDIREMALQIAQQAGFDVHAVNA